MKASKKLYSFKASLNRESVQNLKNEKKTDALSCLYPLHSPLCLFKVYH